MIRIHFCDMTVMMMTLSSWTLLHNTINIRHMHKFIFKELCFFFFSWDLLIGIALPMYLFRFIHSGINLLWTRIWNEERKVSDTELPLEKAGEKAQSELFLSKLCLPANNINAISKHIQIYTIVRRVTRTIWANNNSIFIFVCVG